MFVFKSAQPTWLSDTQEMEAGGELSFLTSQWRPNQAWSSEQWLWVPRDKSCFYGVFCLFVCFSWFCWRRRESAWFYTQRLKTSNCILSLRSGDRAVTGAVVSSPGVGGLGGSAAFWTAHHKDRCIVPPRCAGPPIMYVLTFRSIFVTQGTRYNYLQCEATDKSCVSYLRVQIVTFFPRWVC